METGMITGFRVVSVVSNPAQAFLACFELWPVEPLVLTRIFGLQNRLSSRFAVICGEISLDQVGDVHGSGMTECETIVFDTGSLWLSAHPKLKDYDSIRRMKVVGDLPRLAHIT
jgi:hypothetical protein